MRRTSTQGWEEVRRDSMEIWHQPCRQIGPFSNRVQMLLSRARGPVLAPNHSSGATLSQALQVLGTFQNGPTCISLTPYLASLFPFLQYFKPSTHCTISMASAWSFPVYNNLLNFCLFLKVLKISSVSYVG